MNVFSILLIENQLCVAAAIVQVLGQHLASYRLSIASGIAEAITEQKPTQAILLDVSQLAGNVSGNLSSLKAAYPDTPIILLQESPFNKAEDEILLETLSAGVSDYVSLSEAGLLVLGRRLAALQTTWLDQQRSNAADIHLNIGKILDQALASDTSQLAVQLIGSDNRVRVWNRAAETFFGLPQPSTIGCRIEELPLSASNLSRLKDILDQARVTGEPFSIPHYPLENQSGENRWVQVYVYPIGENLPASAEKRVTDVYIISADVTDLKQIELKHQHHIQELETLLETSHKISEQLELQATLEKIVEQAKSLLNADNCHVYFLEKDNQTLRPIVSDGLHAKQIKKTSLTVGQGVVGSVATTGKAVMVNFAGSESDTLYGRRVNITDEEHFLCAPLTALKGIMGLIIVTRTSPPPFTKDELRFFENLAQQASSAINNARLIEETQRNLIELETLYEASATISTTWDSGEVLNTLIRQMVQALKVSGGHIVSWNQKLRKGAIQAKFLSNDNRTPISEAELNLSFNLAKRPALSVIINQQRPVFFQLSNPALGEAERADMEKQGYLSRLLVPLVVKGETIGWAELWETGQERLFTTDEIRLVRMLANQAAVALENAQYLKQTQRTLEEMTALYQVVSALATTQDSQTLMSIVLQEYLQALGVRQGSVIIFDFEARCGVVKINFQDDQPLASTEDREGARHHVQAGLEGQQIPLENDLVYRQLMRTYRPVVIENAQAGPSPATTPYTAQSLPNTGGWAGATALSLLIIPLQIRGEIVGAIVAEDTCRQRTFEQWEISLGQAMADQLGIALQNAQLYESEYQRRVQAETLREVSFVVGSSLNLNEVLEHILDQLRRVVKYDSAAIHLIQGKRRRVIAGRGFPNPEQVIGMTFPATFDKNEPGSIAIHTRQPMVNGNIAEHFGVFKHPDRSYIKSWMGIPLIARDKVIGLISIDHTEIDAYNEEDVQLAMAFANQVAIALENARLHEIEVRELERELEIAHGIQKTLLPQFIPEVPGLQIAGNSIPARQIGGDFFHFFSIGEDQLGVAIGDVSGKGIPAALYMAATITAIDTKIEEELTPSELLNHLNRTLYNRLQENKMNVGLQIATFAPQPSPVTKNGKIEREARSSLVTVANAGMIAPIGATSHGCRFLPVSGLPVGSIPAPYQVYQEDIFLLDPYTTIIFTSDGIVEAQNEYGELFSFERLEDVTNQIVATRDAQAIADHIIHSAQEFMGSAEQTDDMTVVVVVKT